VGELLSAATTPISIFLQTSQAYGVETIALLATEIPHAFPLVLAAALNIFFFF
jgi:hypothetical protein